MDQREDCEGRSSLACLYIEHSACQLELAGQSPNFPEIFDVSTLEDC